MSNREPNVTQGSHSDPGKELESFVLMYPIEVSIASVWEPDMINHHRQALENGTFK